MTALGLDLILQKTAGEKSRITHPDFVAAGAKSGGAADAKKADVVLRVRRPSDAEITTLKSGAIVLARTCVFVKRSLGSGYASIDTPCSTRTAR